MQQGIDRYITDASTSIDARISGLATIALFYGALIVLNFVTAFSQVLILEWMGQSIMHKLRQKLFSHLLRLQLPFFNNQPIGRLVTRVTNDIQNMHEMFTSIMVTLFNDLLKMICIIILLINLNLKLGSILCLFVPLAAMITIFFSKLARNHFRDIRRQLSKLNSFIQETVSGINLVQIFGRTKNMEQDFAELNARLIGAHKPLANVRRRLEDAKRDGIHAHNHERSGLVRGLGQVGALLREHEQRGDHLHAEQQNEHEAGDAVE